MDGYVAGSMETARRRAGGPSTRARLPAPRRIHRPRHRPRDAGRRSTTPPSPALLGALVGALLLTAPAAAQQDTTRTDARRDTAGVLLPGAQDTTVQDTTAQDTALTPRQRALRRLRSIPRSPVQPDTTDSAALDSLAADTVGRDTGAVGPPPDVLDTLPGIQLPFDTVARDTAASDTVERDPGRLRPRPPDTARVPLRPGAGEGPEPDSTPPPPRRGREPDPGSMDAATVRERLAALEGYVRTEYRGQGAVFLADSNQLELTGESHISREGSALDTDSLLVYDGDAGVVCGYGRPVLSGEGDPVESSRVCFDVERDVGMADGARTQFTQGGTWYVRGADNRVYVLPRGENDTLYGQRAEFTSCDLEHPHYTFQAQALKMIPGEMMVARDITLQFEDVPVFWLPWMVQSMKRGRRSGLLMPRFGLNDIVRNNAGYNRHLSNIGFYWAIGDHASARSTFEWYAGNWTALEGALTYYWRRQFLRGNLRAKHYWRQQEGAPASREFTLNTSNSWQPDERTRLQLTGNYASSTDFVRTNSFDPQELNQSIRSSASANRSFDWGSVTLGADRRQQLSTGQVDMTLPSLRLSLSPLTLYSGEEGFNVTWTGSGAVTRATRDVQEDSIPGVRDSERFNTSVNQRLSAGKFGIGGNVDYQQETLGGRPTLRTGPDPLIAEVQDILQAPLASPPGAPLPEETTERVRWSSSVGYQQNLWIGTSVTPNVSLSGSQLRNEETRLWTDSLGVGSPNDFVTEPARVSAGASLTTAIYGFWPGVADFSRIRHKIAPSLRWAYSPKPSTTALQDSVFGVRNLRKQNRLTLSFNQTFEAKLAEDDTAAADTVELGQPGEPRRLPQSEKVTLLALNTGTPFVYDFVAAQEDGRGFLTDEVNNSIRSDLLRGLQLSMTHSLFEVGQDAAEGGLPPRTFSPFLTRLSASFSIDNSFWLFRVLGLTAERSRASQQQEEADTTDVEAGQENVGAEAETMGSIGGVGSMVPGGGRRPGPGEGGGGVQGVGQWRAQLSYSLQRSRPTAGGQDRESQLIRASVSFEPTEHWSLRWNTAYSVTDREFANHFLTLTRDLHRWTANFDFIKAQNGNFAMQFRVQLRDNPDLKLDYDQRQRARPAPGRPGTGGSPGTRG